VEVSEAGRVDQVRSQDYGESFRLSDRTSPLRCTTHLQRLGSVITAQPSIDHVQLPDILVAQFSAESETALLREGLLRYAVAEEYDLIQHLE